MEMMPMAWLLLLLLLGSGVSGAEEQDANEGHTEMDAFSSTVTESYTLMSSTYSDEDIVEQWQKRFEKFKSMAKFLVKSALPYLVSSSSDIDIVSAPCRKAGWRFLLALQKLEPWALYMLDASSKGISGILEGTLTSFGSYDQCLNIVATEKKKQESKEIFRGQYCSIKSRPYLPKKPRLYTLGKRMEIFKRFENDTGILREVSKNIQLFYTLSLRFGVCIPSSCSKEDVHAVAKLVIRKLFVAEILEPTCEVKEKNKIEKFQIPAIVIFSLLVAIVLCGTGAELTLNFLESRGKKNTRENSTAMKYLLAFSAYSNFMNLLKTSSASEKLKVLHGIKVYSILWIVLGHTFYYINFSMIKHLKQTIEISKQVGFSIISNSPLVVDNFFFISGLLMTYVTMDILGKTGKKLNVFHFILHRLWRFFPIQMAFVGVATMLPWFGSGPLWHETIDPIVEGCRNEWWTNLIFINNIYRESNRGCVSHSWYLAADFQLYIFSLVILIPLLRKPRLGFFVSFLLIGAQIVAAGLYIYVNDLPPAPSFNNPDEVHRTKFIMETLYVPYQHLGPFCIGILIGYYFKCGKPPKRIHPVIQVLAWIAALTVSSAVLFGLHGWVNGNDQGRLGAALYAALWRVSWTLSVAWITFACTTGYGGILNRLLCWEPLIPLSRLTFMMYMIHPFIQLVVYANLSEGFQAKNYPAVFFFLSVVISGYGLSVILCLFLEYPFVNLGKLIFMNRRRKIGAPINAQFQQTQDKLEVAALDSVSSDIPVTKLTYHSSQADLVAQVYRNRYTGRAYENGDVVYHL